MTTCRRKVGSGLQLRATSVAVLLLGAVSALGCSQSSGNDESQRDMTVATSSTAVMPSSSMVVTSTSVSTTVAAPPSTSLPNGPEATLAEFNRIQSGMTYAAVQAIIGSPGTIKSQSATTMVVQWQGNGSGGSNIAAVFSDGLLQTKAQSGLL